MPDATSTVTVALKFALVGGGLQALDQAGNKVGDLIKLEQRLEQQVQRTGNAQRRPRGAADTYRLADGPAGRGDAYRLADDPGDPVLARLNAARDRRREERTAAKAAEAQQQRERVLGSLGAQRQQELARAERERQEATSPAAVARAVIERQQQREAIVAELQKAGFDGSGNRLAAQPGRGSSAAGFAMRAAGGGLGYVASAAPGLVANSGNQQRNPYTSDRTRAEEFYRGVPLYGQAFGTGLDIGRNLTGESRVIGSLARRTDEQSVRIPLENALAGREAGLRRDESLAARRVQAFSGTAPTPEASPFAGPYAGPQRTPGVDRGTVAGQRRYEEESRLLPIRRELAKLDREEWASQRAIQDSTSREVNLTRELSKLDQERAAAKKKYEAVRVDTGWTGFGGSPSREKEALDNAAAINKRRAGVQSQLEDEQAAGKDARQQAEAVKARRRQLEIQQNREELAIARDKEQQAGDKSVTLSQMGVGGRETAKIALQMAKEVGVENLPPELRDVARAAAPDTMRRLEMEEGDRYKDDFKGLVDDGERGFDRDKDARKRTDAAEGKVFEQEDLTARADVQGISDAIKGFADKVVAVVKAAIQAEVEAMTVERMRANLSGGGV